MAQQTAKFYCDIQAEVYAESYEADYGVERSPTWTEYHKEEVGSVFIWIGGNKFELPVDVLPEELKKALKQEAIDNCYSDEWEE